jgi:hypothetical protein
MLILKKNSQYVIVVVQKFIILIKHIKALRCAYAWLGTYRVAAL